jgi:hypothetical protein
MPLHPEFIREYWIAIERQLRLLHIVQDILDFVPN